VCHTPRPTFRVTARSAAYAFASPTIRSSRNSTLAPVPQAAVIRVQVPRLHIEQGEHVAADALPPLRLYPPLGLRVFQVDTRVVTVASAAETMASISSSSCVNSSTIAPFSLVYG